MTSKNLQIFAWTITLGAAAVSSLAWWQTYGSVGLKSIYTFFPLLGLIAFSLMWGHYIAAAVRTYTGIDKAVLKQYFKITSLIVLAAILLHPGLLIFQLSNDGYGLPPGSTLSYVQPSMRIAVVMGIISLFIFLAYEFHRKYGDRQWWKYVGYASDVAMVLIFIHAIRLGGQLQGGWFRVVWLLYGATLVAAIAYTRFIAKPKT